MGLLLGLRDPRRRAVDARGGKQLRRSIAKAATLRVN